MLWSVNQVNDALTQRWHSTVALPASRSPNSVDAWTGRVANRTAGLIPETEDNGERAAR